MKNQEGRTIAAISTAYGEGGIGIVRMSGEEAHSILTRIFPLPDNIDDFQNRYLHHGYIKNPKNDAVIDEVLVAFMKGPHTYTKEDVCEIYCHGSIISLKKILELVLELGAENAQPGEFTKRAFLNGRIDLTQAEAVIDVIKAKTDVGFELAVDQMEGAISKEINSLREQILNIIATIVVDIDYPDEDKEAVRNLELADSLKKITTQLNKLIQSANAGKMIREGINTVIAGKPNTGKSSLMNQLLKESRAIVTDIPGTTRDTIEESISIKGIPIILTDTAGIRATSDKIEQIGIEKTKEAFNKADLIIFMVDAETGIDEYDKEIAEKIGKRNCITLINKIDLDKNVDEATVKSLIPQSQTIQTSLKENRGIEELEEKISNLVFSGDLKQENSLVVTNVRHKDLLKKAKLELDEAMSMIDSGEALDFAHVNINQAFEYLGEITGQSVTDDILDKVFSEFCVGK